MEIFIPGNVPSSKNSRMKTRWGGFIKSPLCFKYEKDTENIFSNYRLIIKELVEELDKPVFIKLHIVRDSRRRYDFNNISQMLADLMVKNEWIVDDNTTEVYFIPYIKNEQYQTIDKENCGVWININNDKI